ncbi:arabinosyltransferase domain-containing protein [Nocardia cyriacigeorgica]|uniref:arabinosyltransferase domain-containing protein n=1 Tax=Nocardia cyriacigeorgica TaxID=135487 RepID=UPI0018950948|nr:arabinosyltransferase domain-containing protein [Nocardia cyriacigeorgica]MBF6413191.1 arabinosyltransferase domain-containing protein [Nocardia cyriacigeorgica]
MRPDRSPRAFNRLRLIALVSGFLGFVLALLTPLLPVRQDRAVLDWPQAGQTSVEAPLVSYEPLRLDLTVPCPVLRDATGTLVSTIPMESDQASAKGLIVAVRDGSLSVLLRDVPLLSAPVAEIGDCDAVRVTSEATATSAEIVGVNRADGTPFRATVTRDIRPQMVGVFTELAQDRLDGIRLHAEIDSRFSSSPSASKLAAMIVAVLSTIVALIALHLLDTSDGRRARRFLPAHWWRFTLADGAVLGTLALWHVIGANTSDDGYILNMARASEHAGYMANYYRWFGVPEAPFGWSYEVLSWMTHISDASPWMRLPALLAGVVCWLVISREVLPRLGARVRRNKVALWTAGLVFLAFWLPYDNGLRPEPLIAAGALLTWCSIERAIATSRLLPAAIGILIAAFSLAAGPTGLICIAALIAGSRPVLQVIVKRARGEAATQSVLEEARAHLRGPGDARTDGTAVLGDKPRSVDQASSGDDTRSAGEGPAEAGGGASGKADGDDALEGADSEASQRPGTETPRVTAGAAVRDADAKPTQRPRGSLASGLFRYAALLAPGIAAGTLVLVVIFADQTLATVMEATRVRTIVGPNVAWFDERTRWDSLLMLAPDGSLSRRFGVLLMLLCLLVCVLQVLRKGRIPGTSRGPSVRILGIVFASLLLMMWTPTKWTHHFGVYAGLAGSLAALAAVAVGVNGIRSARNRALFAAAVLFLLAITFTGSNGWWYVSSYGVPWWDKAPLVAGKGVSTLFLGLSVIALLVALWLHYRQPYRRAGASRWGRYASAPLTIAAALMVIFEVASLAKAAASQYPAYSVAKSNVRSLAGEPCALADSVLVETNTADSLLVPYEGDPANGLVSSESGVETVGFTPDGVADDLTADAEEVAGGGANTVESDNDNKTSDTTGAGTGGGTTAQAGINGSTVALPFGLDPARTPVLGSYQEDDQKQAKLTTQWYRLDLSDSRRDDPALRVLTITAAGRIRSVDADGVLTYGQDLVLEYGTRAADGTMTVLGAITPTDIGPAPSWRNLRVPLDQLPAEVNAVRLVATDNDITQRQWLAITPPRLPRLATLDSVVGHTDPVLLDWHVGLAFPCQRPFDHRYGVAEVPRWRILPDRVGSDASNAWQDDIGGGPLGWTELLLQAKTVPTYLNDDWGRDWGSLEQFTPYDPNAAPAELNVTTVTRSGLAEDSPIRIR